MSIFSDIKECHICDHTLPLGARPIIQGHNNSRILIAGQAPSAVAHKTGKPFDDASGNTLRTWLNVDEATFYDPNIFAIAPMAFCYPGKGNSGDAAPPSICSKTWRKQLISSFSQLELTIVIGQYAQKYHFKNYTNVTDTTKQWRSLLPTYIALPHPSPRNRFWIQKNPWFQKDLIPDLQRITHNVITKNK